MDRGTILRAKMTTNERVDNAAEQVIANADVNADKIIVLKKGEIIETGTHSELCALNGAYKKLVERQMKTDELST